MYSTLIQCHFGHACNAKSSTNSQHQTDGTFTCGDGYDQDSLLCSKCKAGWFESPSSCLPCAEGSQAFIPILTVLFALLLLWYLWDRAGTNAVAAGGVAAGGAAKYSQIVFIFFFYWQLMSLLDRSSSPSSSSSNTNNRNSNKFFNFLQSLSNFRPFALECIDSRVDHTVYSAIAMLLPATLPLFMLLCLGPLLWLLRRLTKTQTQTQTQDLFSHITQVTFFMWKIMYFPLLNQCLSWLNCESVTDHDGFHLSYLSRAPYIDCTSSTYRIMSGVAGMMLALFGFVLPIAALWKAIRVRRQLQLNLQLQLQSNQAKDEEDEASEDGKSGDGDDDQQEQQQQQSASPRGASPHVSLPLSSNINSNNINTKIANDPATPLLSTTQHHQHQQHHQHNPIEFLWNPFIPKLWWFYFVQLIFQISLSAIQALLPFFSALLPILLFFLLIVWLVIILKFRPYHYHSDNLLEVVLLMATTLAYLVTIVDQSYFNYEQRDVLETLAIVIKYMVAVGMGVGLVWYGWHRRQTIHRVVSKVNKYVPSCCCSCCCCDR